MKMFDNLDRNPYVGEFVCSDPVKVKLKDLNENPNLKNFFNDTHNYPQITTVTHGKLYNMISYRVLGDVADVAIIDDKGDAIELMSGFFEEAD